MGPTVTSFIALLLSATAGDGRLVGRVTYPGGVPVPGAQVTVFADWGQLTTETDRKGRYTILTVPKGDASIMFRLGEVAVTQEVAVRHSFTVEANAILEELGNGVISGIVRDKDTGQPIAGVTVVAQGPKGELAEVTGDRGNYTITDVPAGKYLVRFFVPGGNAPKLMKEAQVGGLTTVRVNATFSQKEDADVRERVVFYGCRWPPFDSWSAKRSTKFDRDYFTKVPLR